LRMMSSPKISGDVRDPANRSEPPENRAPAIE
jgi:hypothetical protein